MTIGRSSLVVVASNSPSLADGSPLCADPAGPSNGGGDCGGSSRAPPPPPPPDDAPGRQALEAEAVVGNDYEDEDETEMGRPAGHRRLSRLEELRDLVRIGGPVIVTSVLEYLPTPIMLAFVGYNTTGSEAERTDALAGASLAGSLASMLTLSIGFGLNTGLDTLCTQAVGAGRQELLSVYLLRAVAVQVLMLGPAAAVNLNAERMVAALGHNAVVARETGRFAAVMLPGLSLSVLYDSMMKPLQAQGKTTPMVAVGLLSNGVMVGLCYLLVSVWRLDTVAAAWAFTATYLTFVLVLGAYMYWTGVLQLVTRGWCSLRGLTLAGLSRYLRLAVPGMVALCADWWTFDTLVFISGLLPDPTNSLAACAILYNIQVVTYFSFVGVSVGACARVGNSLGAGGAREARHAATTALMAVATLAVAVISAEIPLRDRLAQIFTDDPEVSRAVAGATVGLAVYQFGDAVGTCAGGVFRGGGQQRMAATANVLSYWVVGLPMAYIFAFRAGLGVAGLWFGIATGSWLAGFVTTTLVSFSDYGRLVVRAATRLSLDIGPGAEAEGTESSAASMYEAGRSGEGHPVVAMASFVTGGDSAAPSSAHVVPAPAQS